MSKIYLIRHGQAAASFTDDLDPGLDELGQAQAAEAARQLMAYLPLKLLSSPLKRAQETGQALAELTGQPITIEQRVAEVPSPGLSLEERGPWLKGVMSGLWKDQSAELLKWQQDMVDCLLAIKQDTAIFSHFVAINALVAAAENRQEVMVFRPNNCSITSLEVEANQLKVLSRGNAADTHIN